MIEIPRPLNKIDIMCEKCRTVFSILNSTKQFTCTCGNILIHEDDEGVSE